jgi:hypothetical protein
VDNEAGAEESGQADEAYRPGQAERRGPYLYDQPHEAQTQQQGRQHRVRKQANDALGPVGAHFPNRCTRETDGSDQRGPIVHDRGRDP